MFGELENPDQSNDPQKGEGGATILTAGALLGHEHCKQRDVVRHDGDDVDDVLEVLPEGNLVGADDEPDDQLEGEPRVADGLDDEERVRPVGHVVLHAAVLPVLRQRLDAQQDDRAHRHRDRNEGDREGGFRRFRELEKVPDVFQSRVRHDRNLVLRVAFRLLVVVDDVPLDLEEEQFLEEDFVGDGVGSPQPSAVHVISEDDLEARSVPVEEVLVPFRVVVPSPLFRISEQRFRMSLEHVRPDVEVLPAHVYSNSIVRHAIRQRIRRHFRFQLLLLSTSG